MAHSIACISEQKAASMRRHRLHLGDIVFSRRGGLSRAAAIQPEQAGWVCGTGCFLLRVSQESVGSEWLSYVYRSDGTQRQVLAGAVGSTMLSLNNAVMAALLIAWPHPEEQREIVRRLIDYDRRIQLEHLQLEKLRALKSDLMHDLLTGKVHVPSREAAS